MTVHMPRSNLKKGKISPKKKKSVGWLNFADDAPMDIIHAGSDSRIVFLWTKFHAKVRLLCITQAFAMLFVVVNKMDRATQYLFSIIVS